MSCFPGLKCCFEASRSILQVRDFEVPRFERSMITRCPDSLRLQIPRVFATPLSHDQRSARGFDVSITVVERVVMMATKLGLVAKAALEAPMVD